MCPAKLLPGWFECRCQFGSCCRRCRSKLCVGKKAVLLGVVEVPQPHSAPDLCIVLSCAFSPTCLTEKKVYEKGKEQDGSDGRIRKGLHHFSINYQKIENTLQNRIIKCYISFTSCHLFSSTTIILQQITPRGSFSTLIQLTHYASPNHQRIPPLFAFSSFTFLSLSRSLSS